MSDSKDTRALIDWDIDKITSLWRYYAQNPEYRWSYFSLQKGEDLLCNINKYLPADGKTIDIGCAIGVFLEKLLHNGMTCGGADFSAESVDLVNEKFKNNKHFLGARRIETLTNLPYENNYADTVIFLETLEHLFPKQVHAIAIELHRITKDKGHIILTTPNNEDLSKQFISCNKCNIDYHRYQHMQSFNNFDVKNIMEKAGFKTISCKATRLRTKPIIAIKYFISRVRAKSKLFCPNCNKIFIDTAINDTNIFKIFKKLLKSYLQSKTIIYIGKKE